MVAASKQTSVSDDESVTRPQREQLVLEIAEELRARSAGPFAAECVAGCTQQVACRDNPVKQVLVTLQTGLRAVWLAPCSLACLSQPPSIRPHSASPWHANRY